MAEFPSMFRDLHLRRQSRKFFGQDHRLSVLIAISRRRGTFTASDIAADIGAQHTSSIQGPIAVLRDLGFILDTSPTSKERLYTRAAESTIWAFARELEQRIQGQDTLFPDR